MIDDYTMTNELNVMLSDATLQGKIEQVKNLIERGANLNVMDDVGEYPIHVASEKGNIDIIKFLIKNGADLDVLTRPGYSAAHIAVLYNQLEALKLLLENVLIKISAIHMEILCWRQQLFTTMEMITLLNFCLAED